MSIDTCDRCVAAVDTDFDLDCYVGEDMCICERCRELAEVEAQRQNQINDEERA